MAFWGDNRTAFWGECHYIVVVERRDYILDEIARTVAVFLSSEVAENVAELFNPALYVVFGALGHASELRVSEHSVAAYVHFLPATEVCKELDVETLIAVLFG